MVNEAPAQVATAQVAVDAASAAAQALTAAAKKLVAPVTETFRKGVAISVWQNSSDPGLSNWTRFAYQRWPLSWLGIGTTRGKHKVGKSCDFWNK